MPLFSERHHGEQIYARYCELVPLAERRHKAVVLGMYWRLADPNEGAIHDDALYEAQRRLLSVESSAIYLGEREP